MNPEAYVNEQAADCFFLQSADQFFLPSAPVLCLIQMTPQSNKGWAFCATPQLPLLGSSLG
jgi:hypothetical protein